MRSIRPLLLALPVLLGTLLLPACGGGAATPESLMDEMRSIQGDLIEVLSKVEDADSAEVAAEKIPKLAEAMKAVQTQMEAMPEPSEGDLPDMGPMMEDLQKLGMELMRIEQLPEASAILAPALEALDTSK